MVRVVVVVGVVGVVRRRVVARYLGDGRLGLTVVLCVVVASIEERSPRFRLLTWVALLADFLAKQVSALVDVGRGRQCQSQINGGQDRISNLSGLLLRCEWR